MEEDKSGLSPELEKVRADKCLPIVRKMMDDFATDLLTEESIADYRALVKKMLQYSLDADLNLTTETTFIPQVLLGALSGLNMAVQGAAMEPLDEARYARIGKQILGIWAGANIRLGDVTPEESAEDFSVPKMQIEKLFADEKLTKLEVKFIMDNIFNSFSVVQTMYARSIESSMEKAEEKLFGIEAMSDLTLQYLDKVLKATTAPVK